MANVAKLKDRARALEQSEQWQQALDVYREVVDHSEGDHGEVAVWNRIGDLELRLGHADRAVAAFENAVDGYRQAGLYNNAIALCNKILRVVPGRAPVYLRLGQISAAQGFLADARASYLQYAERMQRAGELDASFAALKDFAALSPEDAEVRRLLAEQLRSHGHEAEAVEQLQLLLGQLLRDGDAAAADEVRAQIQMLDPDADVSGDGRESAAPARSAEPDRGGGLDLLPTLSLDLPAAAAAPDGEVGMLEGFETHADFGAAADEPAEGAATEPTLELSLPEFGPVGDDAGDGDAPESEPLPLLGFGDVADEDDEDEVSGAGASGFEVRANFSILDSTGAPPAPEPARATPPAPAARAGDLPLLDFTIDTAEPDDAAAAMSAAAALPESADPLPSLGGFDDPAPAAAPIDEVAALRARADADAADAAAGPLVDLLLAQGAEAEAAERLAAAYAAHARAGRFADAADAAERLVALRPDDVALLQKRVELAYRSGQRDRLVPAYLALAVHLQSGPTPEKAAAVYERVLEADPANEAARVALATLAALRARPAAPAEDAYIDLAALILEDIAEPTTRFVVAEEEPTGDEDRDFADMLSRFRQKVAENIATEDSASHYDLGVAFKEMGLVDEAIAQFQVALRGGANPLATLELLGDCFVEKGQHALASRVLERALRFPGVAETDLLGVYYLLARCEEAHGQMDRAQELLERVLAVDIRFRDAAARLRSLRSTTGLGL